MHYALTLGEIRPEHSTVVRVQTVNTLRDLLGTRIDGVDAGWSYRRAMQYVAEQGEGCVVLIGQPVSAEQSLEEVLQFPANPGPSRVDSVEGVQNYRLIGTGSQILRRLGVGRMRLRNNFV